MAWNMLHAMRQREASRPLGLAPGSCDPGQRAALVDFVVGLASTLSLTDYTLHLAVAVVDRYLGLQDGPVAADDLQIVGVTSLKVADVFAEQSKEYYKQENVVEYAEATLHQVSSEQILVCEKDLLPKLEFDLHLPTTHWFLQCYLAYGRFASGSRVAKTACFVGDLALLDHGQQAHAAPLRAQCALVLGAFLAQQAAAGRGPGAPGPAPEEPAPARRAPAAGAPGEEEAGKLRSLELWDSHVRSRVCSGNVAIDAAMCLQAVVRALVVLRREWKSAKLTAVEVKHAGLARTLVYPERFPVSRLVRYIIPDAQRGLIPE